MTVRLFLWAAGYSLIELVKDNSDIYFIFN
jgi:hypothetical protein